MADPAGTARIQLAVRKHLIPLGPDLIESLRRLLGTPLVPEVRRLEFEIFCDGFTEGFPVRTFFLDQHDSEHFVRRNGKLEYPSPVDPGLLAIEYVYPREVEAALATGDPDLDYLTIAGEAIVPWFAECWRAAGGSSFDREASIGLHDDSRRYDLRTHRWTETRASF